MTGTVRGLYFRKGVDSAEVIEKTKEIAEEFGFGPNPTELLSALADGRVVAHHANDLPRQLAGDFWLEAAKEYEAQTGLWLTTGTLQLAVAKAAALLSHTATRLRFYSTILSNTRILHIELAGGRISLTPETVKLLRALLLSYDEDREPEPGDQLEVPSRKADGTISTYW
jgi:hypothetical protein